MVCYAELPDDKKSEIKKEVTRLMGREMFVGTLTRVDPNDTATEIAKQIVARYSK